MSVAGAGPRTRLRPDLLRDFDTLGALEPRWRRAAEVAGSVFLTPDWFRQHFEAHPRAQPAVIAVRDEAGEVVALIPLVDDGRTVRFAGAAFGDRFGAVVLDRDVIDPVGVWRYASPVFRRLAKERLIVLDRIDSVVQPRARGAMNFVESSEVLPYIPLRDTTWEHWLADRSGNFRSQISRKQKRLDQAAAVSFVEVRDSAHAEAALEAHFELHYRRREAVGDQSSLASDAARTFHYGLVRRLAAHDWLRLWLLECDGAPVASWYGWRIGSSYAYYQAGFDAAWADYSPGMLLMVKTVAAAFAEGAGEYDLLLGDEQYKQRFTVSERFVQTTLMGSPMSAPFLRACGLAGIRRLYRMLPGELRTLTRRAVAPYVRATPLDTPSGG